MASGGTSRPASAQPRAGLSLDQVVSATLALIDEQGLGSASMRTIAGRLGVEAQSLYTYVDSRDDLLDAVVEQVVDELADDPEVGTAADGAWRNYLTGMAHGVRRYAQRHPRAFPLVSTRPSEAPWVNPPLRSLRWIESFMATLQRSGFTDDEVLFAYRTFNGFLLGFLLLETGSMALDEPAAGDGSFAGGSGGGRTGDARAPVPGALTPTRSARETRALERATTVREKFDPVGDIDASRFPTLHRLARKLAHQHYDAEFDTGLAGMLDRIAAKVADRPTPTRAPRERKST